MQTVLAQPDLPQLPSDTVLQDPGSSSFSDDIFFDDFSLSNTDTTTTSTAATTPTTAATTTPAADTTTIADSATGPETNLVFWIAGVLAILTLLIVRQIKQKYE